MLAGESGMEILEMKGGNGKKRVMFIFLFTAFRLRERKENVKYFSVLDLILGSLGCVGYYPPC